MAPSFEFRTKTGSVNNGFVKSIVWSRISLIFTGQKQTIANGNSAKNLRRICFAAAARANWPLGRLNCRFVTFLTPRALRPFGLTCEKREFRSRRAGTCRTWKSRQTPKTRRKIPHHNGHRRRVEHNRHHPRVRTNPYVSIDWLIDPV